MSITGLHYVCKRKPGKPVRWYIYAYRGGPMIAKREGGSRPRLTRDESQDALNAIEALRKPDPKTFLPLIREFEASQHWASLADGTRKTWGSQLRVIEAKWGSLPRSLWNDPRMVADVMEWRDSRADTPRAADVGVTVLYELLKYHKRMAKILLNVADDIPTLYRGGQRAEIIWTEEDIDRFCWYALRLDRPQMIDGIWLAQLTGMRRQDLVTVNTDNLFEHAIVKKALKVSRRKRRTATLPRIPELDDLLAELKTRYREPGVTTLLVNSRGKPWSGDGFGGSFNRIRDKAEIFHVDPETGERKAKHLHDVRGTFATRLILNGLNDKDVADVMGWSVETVATIRRVYVDQARVVVAMGERMARGTVNRPVNHSDD